MNDDDMMSLFKLPTRIYSLRRINNYPLLGCCLAITIIFATLQLSPKPSEVPYVQRNLASQKQHATNSNTDFRLTEEKTQTLSRKLYEGALLSNDTTLRIVLMDIKRLVASGEVPTHTLSLEEPYRSRMTNLRKQCAKTLDDRTGRLIDLKRMVFDDTHKVILCVIPKNAGTTWKSIIWYLKGRSKLDNAFNVSGEDLVLRFGRFETLAGLSSAGVVSRLNTYTKFMVTRHPFDRLVSSYYNKVQVPDGKFAHQVDLGRMAALKAARSYIPDLQIDWGRSIYEVDRRVKANAAFKELSDVDQKTVEKIVARGFHGNAPFKEFLEQGILPKENQTHGLDIHYRPQYKLCNPCAISYDYVIDFNNLAQESERLLHWLQKDDPPEKRIRLPKRKSTVGKNTTEKEFARLPAEDIRKLGKIYKHDFDYFSYSIL